MIQRTYIAPTRPHLNNATVLSRQLSSQELLFFDVVAEPAI